MAAFWFYCRALSSPFFSMAEQKRFSKINTHNRLALSAECSGSFCFLYREKAELERRWNDHRMRSLGKEQVAQTDSSPVAAQDLPAAQEEPSRARPTY